MNLKSKWIFVTAILVVLYLIFYYSNSNQQPLQQKQTPIVSETKTGHISSYYYSYFSINDKIILTYDRGIYVGNESVTETSSLILFYIAKTIKSISNDKDIFEEYVHYEPSYTRSLISNNKTSMKGKNGLYEITFALTGDYLTNITYKCIE